MAPGLDPCSLHPYTFLHIIYTVGVKIRPALRKSYILHEEEKVKS